MRRCKLAQAMGLLGLSTLPFALVACRPLDYQGNLAGPRVAVVGDSITALAGPDIYGLLDPVYATEVRGYSDETMAQVFPAIEQIQNQWEGPPLKWVAELGTNDAGWEQNPNWQSDFDTEVAFLARAAPQCVQLVTVQPHLGAIAQGLDQAMRAWAASHPSFHVLDWGTWVDQHPSYLEPDGVHPNSEGETALAFFIRLALASC
jgi:hypothetical protein